MKLQVATPNTLFTFLKSTLPFHSFRMYMHILTEPYLSLLAGLPVYVKNTSSVYLDGEKNKINDYAVRVLRKAGYKSVWYVRRLHSKVIVIGSKPNYIVVGTSNLSSRSFANYELVLIIENPTKPIVEQVKNILMNPVESQKYAP